MAKLWCGRIGLAALAVLTLSACATKPGGQSIIMGPEYRVVNRFDSPVGPAELRQDVKDKNWRIVSDGGHRVDLPMLQKANLLSVEHQAGGFSVVTIENGSHACLRQYVVVTLHADSYRLDEVGDCKTAFKFENHDGGVLASQVGRADPMVYYFKDGKRGGPILASQLRLPEPPSPPKTPDKKPAPTSRPERSSQPKAPAKPQEEAPVPLMVDVPKTLAPLASDALPKSVEEKEPEQDRPAPKFRLD